MRVDASVSLRQPGAPLGTRAEVKNVNSPRMVAYAIGRSHLLAPRVGTYVFVRVTCRGVGHKWNIRQVQRFCFDILPSRLRDSETKGDFGKRRRDCERNEELRLRPGVGPRFVLVV